MKKVLLRERKRHTDCGVSSTPSVTRGGVPPLGIPPSQVWHGGVLRWDTPSRGTVCPSVCLSTPGGYPSQVQMGGGGYPSQVQLGSTPPWVPPIRPDQGVPTSGTPLSDLAQGSCQNITFPSYYVRVRQKYTFHNYLWECIHFQMCDNPGDQISLGFVMIYWIQWIQQQLFWENSACFCLSEFIQVWVECPAGGEQLSNATVSAGTTQSS